MYYKIKKENEIKRVEKNNNFNNLENIPLFKKEEYEISKISKGEYKEIRKVGLKEYKINTTDNTFEAQTASLKDPFSDMGNFPPPKNEVKNNDN